jgi:hypothetical protein
LPALSATATGDLVKQFGRSRQHIEMPVGYRVEGAGVNAMTHGEGRIEADGGGFGHPVFQFPWLHACLRETTRTSSPSFHRMSLPNILTLSRVPLMFVVVALMYSQFQWSATIAFWLDSNRGPD